MKERIFFFESKLKEKRGFFKKKKRKRKERGLKIIFEK
jgi:hypothetical protein